MIENAGKDDTVAVQIVSDIGFCNFHSVVIFVIVRCVICNKLHSGLNAVVVICIGISAYPSPQYTFGENKTLFGITQAYIRFTGNDLCISQVHRTAFSVGIHRLKVGKVTCRIQSCISIHIVRL